jgi:peptide/nickel transport system permease protein
MPGSIPGFATASSGPADLAEDRSPRGTSGGRLWALARRKPVGAVSAAILCLLLAVALLAPWLAPYDPYQLNFDCRGLPIRMQAPSWTFPLGTDPLGRDVLSRIVYGARISLVVGFASVLIGTALGTLVGLACGYLEGRIDSVLQRGVDTVMAVPGIVLALAIVSVLGQSLTNVILVIGLVIAPGASRVVRGAVLVVKQNSYIDAAHAAGATPGRIVVRHILPNVFAPILIIATVWLGNAIVIESALSFLGLGTPPPIPTWGGMLSGEGRRNLETAPYLAIFPGLAISIVVLAFNMFGDALRDLLDPRLRTSR